MTKIVIAFGGNALLKNNDKRDYDTQVKRAKSAFETISGIIEMHDVIITHGNGPQVGDIFLKMGKEDEIPPSPLHVCGSMSQGMIGEILMDAYEQVRISKGLLKIPITILTRTRVDENDQGLKTPTKPIGKFYSEEEFKKLNRKDWNFIKTEKGYRRVVPSPEPIEIIEKDAVNNLLLSGYLPICTGGGGIPVIKRTDRIESIDAVIDKDLASAVLATQIEADVLAILTDVNGVFLNYGKEDQKMLSKVKVDEIDEYIERGEFSKGSMLPKVQAAVKFVRNGGKKAVIGSLENADKVINGEDGTLIIP
ncbi:carbamate kinase [Caldiplasma sukawensis]